MLHPVLGVQEIKSQHWEEVQAGAIVVRVTPKWVATPILSRDCGQCEQALKLNDFVSTSFSGGHVSKTITILTRAIFLHVQIFSYRSTPSLHMRMHGKDGCVAQAAHVTLHMECTNIRTRVANNIRETLRTCDSYISLKSSRRGHNITRSQLPFRLHE